MPYTQIPHSGSSVHEVNRLPSNGGAGLNPAADPHALAAWVKKIEW